ncbi:MAG TPA: PilZ domain-containing protein [Gaiellales bacterium]|jgi:c-di-GMP-binding flagellar brake protein YcgR
MHTDRRAFLRVMAEFPVGVTRLDADAEPASFAAATVNICAGGAKMIAPLAVIAGEHLRLEVRFAQPPFLVFSDATVTRVEEAGDERSVCGLRFDDLDMYIEQRIVRWVFSEQRRVAERRAAVRVPVEVPAWCEPAAGGGQFRARTIDLAGDGARIVTDRALVPGDRVHIQLDVDQPAYRVACVAEVVWANMVGEGRWAYGLRFHGLDRPTQRQIVDHAIASDDVRRRANPS